MSAFKTILTFATGIASGLAIAYLADPKGSQKKMKKIEKDLGKTRKSLDKKLAEYKGNYNEIVETYAGKSKELLEQARNIVDGAKNSVKA